MQQIFNKYIDYLEVERNSSAYTVRNYTTDLFDFFRFLGDSGIDSLSKGFLLFSREKRKRDYSGGTVSALHGLPLPCITFLIFKLQYKLPN